MALRRRTWIWSVAAVLVVLAAVTLVWFQPQKLFYDQRVDEALPSVAAGETDGTEPQADGSGTADPTEPPAPTGPVELASGTFVSREHETVGTARVLQLPDGQVIIRFEGFETSNGPVLVVWLSQNTATGPDDAFDDEYLDLGPLKGNIGDQNYVVPEGVDAASFTSVVVWCDRFNVSFGAADLSPSAAS
ncbi:DM13 domain-containing protein [Geodermatophilus sp. SYSU D00691]